MRREIFLLAALAICDSASAMLGERSLTPPEQLARRLLLKGKDSNAGWKEQEFVFEGPGMTNRVVARIPVAALGLGEHYRFTAPEKRIRGLLGAELHTPIRKKTTEPGTVTVRPKHPFRRYAEVTAEVATFGHLIGTVMSNVRFPTEKAARDEAEATVAELMGMMPLMYPETVVKNHVWLLQTRRISIIITVMSVEDEWTTLICMSDKSRHVLHFSFDPTRFDSEGDGDEFPYTRTLVQDTKMRTAAEVAAFFGLGGRDVGDGATYTYGISNAVESASVFPMASMRLLEDYPLSDKEKCLMRYFGDEVTIGCEPPEGARTDGGIPMVVKPKVPAWPFSMVQVHTNGLGRIDMAASAAGPMRHNEALALAGILKSHFLWTCEMKPECVERGRRWLFQTRRLAFVMTLAQNPQNSDMWGVTLTLHDKERFGL